MAGNGTGSMEDRFYVFAMMQNAGDFYCIR
jgi:hypothetical protein